ncbi:Pre-mRNA-splicing factor SPF27 [Thelohanellus kitauei]|uniref:Pre-mRNA-splicing factor SPF27 n=1 Tax=Thelohanellus kitauei TaxID=669202 RepID=A0A0C2MF12_THEKT|nr:Pre-mRNA-splicing factor SPF27 [Thelohanellus kitauei]
MIFGLLLSALGLSELQRVRDKIKLDVIDLKRYENLPPATESTPFDEIKKYVDESACLYQYQKSNLQNLDLLSEYGSHAWRLHNFYLEKTVNKLKQDYEDIMKKIQEVNYDRRTSQMKIGNDLEYLNKTYNLI